MLTERAGYERRWGSMEELGKLLEGKPLGLNWTGVTSVSNCPFDSLQNLLHVYALLASHREEVQSEIDRCVAITAERLAGSDDFRDQTALRLRDELHHLESALKHASEMFAEFARDVSRLRPR